MNVNGTDGDFFVADLERNGAPELDELGRDRGFEDRILGRNYEPFWERSIGRGV